MGKPSALRTSLIWHDEVMGDVVSERPQSITIGPFDGATFITPDIGLPMGFAIVRPGSRGNVLALGEQMRGTVCIGGVEHDVAALVKTSETPGFYASGIGGLDWGVIELDATGKYKLFFQFVPVDESAAPPLSKQVIAAGFVGYAASIVGLSIMWWSKGFDVGEAMFRGGALATLALGAAALMRWLLKQDNESRASLAFSTILHAAFLFATFQLYERGDAFVWPGPRDLTGVYLVTRLESTPEIQKPAAATPVPTVPKTVPTTIPVTAPWHEPDARKQPVAPTVQQHPVQPTLPPGPPGLDPTAAGAIASLIAGDTHAGVNGLVGGIGSETGRGGGGPGAPGGGLLTRGGPGTGPAGEFKKGGPGTGDPGPIRGQVCITNCAGTQPPEVVIVDPPRDHDEGPTLTKDEIERVIRRASHRLTACYERELNHDPNLAGMLSVRFEIAANGQVTTAKVTRSTIRDEKVGECVSRSITLLKFPPKGKAVVNYPFVFSPKS